ncbi:TatD family hydrolase [Candidatus Saccharibacteria bacterium]|nr:TatD family hydrolase [Candidatus Saccharibacteria bacterium]
MLIDTHCHLHDREFFTAKQAEEMLKRAHGAGIEKIICIGTDPKDSLAARDFAKKHENVYWTYGIHPENATEEVSISHSGSRPAGAMTRAAALRNPPNWDIDTSPIAIGEVGLDYHYDGYNREAQIKLFEEMLQLAQDNDLPVSFHVREAFPDFFAVVNNFPKVRGVVHSFTDSKKVLKRVLNETEYYIGVNGLATYTTLPMPPIERILLETDAPFLAPIPHRGATNEPAFIADIARWLSSQLEISETEVAKITTKNANNLFRLTF